MSSSQDVSDCYRVPRRPSAEFESSITKRRAYALRTQRAQLENEPRATVTMPHRSANEAHDRQILFVEPIFHYVYEFLSFGSGLPPSDSLTIVVRTSGLETLWPHTAWRITRWNCPSVAQREDRPSRQTAENTQRTTATGLDHPFVLTLYCFCRETSSKVHGIRATLRHLCTPHHQRPN